MHFKEVLDDIMECMIPVDVSDMCLIPVLLRHRLSVGALQACLRGKAAPCRLMRMLTPPRFRRLLIDSDAGPLYSAVSSIPLDSAVFSIPPSAQSGRGRRRL
jgi:hypothetical protein